MSPAEPVIHRPQDIEEYASDERCRILETWNRPADPQVSVARARVAPGVSTRWHRLHGTTERYLILAGRGEVELGSGPPQPVGPGDLVYIPRGTAQRITNIGEDELIFLAICTPRFRAEVYEDIDPSP